LIPGAVPQEVAIAIGEQQSSYDAEDA
jgi:hypothetical protein